MISNILKKLIIRVIVMAPKTKKPGSGASGGIK